MNVSTATTAELLSFFNANTGGAQVKKFADRKTAERRCQALADEMFAETQAMVAANPDYQQAGIDRAPTNEEMADEKEIAAWHDGTKGAESEVFGKITEEAAEQSKTAEGACPSCGATLDITSGRIVERAGHQHLVDEGYFTCHGCGHEWGTKDNHYVRPSGAPITSRPEMVKSLKLDRQIESVLTGIVYKNACQVWKAGLVSASQGDRLSAVLYGAAKQGNRLMSITINGHLFALAVR